MSKQVDSVEEFDFGFSFTEENYDEVTTKLAEYSANKETVEDLQSRLNALHNSILPFLDNLCKNPEKNTIHWPNRVQTITAYKKKLQAIVEGN